jgi:transcriptional regulator with XRE-family HTH domain
MNEERPSESKNHSGEQAELDQLAARLREAREYLGLSQEFVAEKLGVPRASISAMETGKRKVSSLELKEMARLYKRPISYFLGEDEERLVADNQTAHALFRTASRLTEEDRIQLLRFAEFLRGAGRAPLPSGSKPK